MQRLRNSRRLCSITHPPAQTDLNDLSGMPRLLLALLLALLACAGHAQEADLYVSGYVHDATKDRPLSGCKVELRQENSEVVIPVPMRKSGEFLVGVATYAAGIPRYTVHISMEGYKAVELRIDATGLAEKVEVGDKWVLDYLVLLAQGTGAAVKSESVFSRGKNDFRFSGPVMHSSEYVKDESLDRHIVKDTMTDSLATVKVFGYVREHWTHTKMAGVEVIIRLDEEPAPYEVLHTDTSGFYAYAFEYNKVYHLTFSYEDRVSKTITLDLRAPPYDSMWNRSFNANVGLFPPIPGEDLSFLNAPMARIRYYAAEETFSSDRGFTEPIQRRLDAILKRSKSR
jgi:hypothetical protein